MHLFWTCQREAGFQKAKGCFEHQFSYIYTEVIKANLWVKGRGYYNETLWALSLSKKYFHIYTHKPPTDTITKNCPRNSSKGYRNSLFRGKTKYPWALKITLHYFRSIPDAVLCGFFFHTANASLCHVRQLLHQGCFISCPYQWLNLHQQIQSIKPNFNVLLSRESYNSSAVEWKIWTAIKTLTCTNSCCWDLPHIGHMRHN